MKKHLIAAAVAGAFAVPAMAQVTVYGILDMGYNTIKANVAGTTTSSKNTGISDGTQSGSRLGFRGEEDLGGGLKASFVIEASLAPTESNLAPGATNRQTFATLSGGFGGISVGRQYTLIHGIQGAYDPNGNASAAGWLPGLTNSLRGDDMIVYSSPSISGLTVQVGMGLAGSENSTSSGATKAGDVTTFGATYSAGPLSVRVVSETTKKTALSVTLPGGTAVGTAATATTTALSDALDDREAMSYGASYDLGVARVMVLATEAEGGSNADKGELSTMNLGVVVPVGALSLQASYSQGDYKDSGARKVDLSGYMLGASYALSKRTNVYAFIGEAENETATKAGKHSTTAIGLRHQF
jgi:predicted porin